MEGQLVWLGVAGSIIGMAFGYLVHGIARPAAEALERWRADYAALRKVAVLSSVLAVVFLGVTFIPYPPFAPGSGLGIGLVIGVAAALFASPFALRGGGPLHRAASAAALAAWALIGACAVAKLFGDTLVATALGYGLGSLLVCGLLRMGIGQARDESGEWFPMEAYAVWALTLAAALTIVEYRPWSGALGADLPLGIGGVLVAATVIGGRILISEGGEQRRGRMLTLAAAAASAIVLAVVALLAWRAYGDWIPLWASLCGTGAVALAAWLLTSNRDPLARTRAVALGVLVILIALVVCFRLTGAYGIGIGLITAWAIGLVMLQATLPGGEGAATPLAARTLIRMLAFGLAFMLYRLFVERYEQDVSHADLRTHYTMIGTLVGLMLPVVIASWRASWARDGETPDSALQRAIAVAFAASLAPAGIALLWGMKATLGLLGGVVGAQIFLILAPLLNGAAPILARSWNMAALGIMTTGVIFCEPIRDWLILSRGQKIYIAIGIGFVLAAWALIAGALGRRARAAGPPAA